MSPGSGVTVPGGEQPVSTRVMPIAFIVAGPACPSAVSPCAACQDFTAASVFGPNDPSAVDPAFPWTCLMTPISAPLVCGPAIPSTVRHRSVWNASVAPDVCGPVIPSMPDHGRYPSPARSHCSCTVAEFPGGGVPPGGPEQLTVRLIPIADMVSGPAWPSALSPCAACQDFTAASVPGPKYPSAVVPAF